MFKQTVFSSYAPDGTPLMGVVGMDDGVFEKTASIHPEILKFKTMLEPEPNKTYVHILALGAGDYYGPNLNNDHFPWSGLSHDCATTPHPYLHGYKTFLNAHAFAHHVNKDPAKSYGDVLVSVLNNRMKRVELIAAIDHERCERNGGKDVLQKIHDGKYPSTSMGCRVPYDECSICGHKAKTRAQYCDHMKLTPGKILDDGRKVFVYNQYPRFFDISFVFIGADRTSFVLEKLAAREAIIVPREYEKIAGQGFGKSLRKGTGVKQKNMAMRVKRKVNRQQKLIPKLTSFGKLNTAIKKSKTAPLQAMAFTQQGYNLTNFGDDMMLSPANQSIFSGRSIKGTDIMNKSASFKLAEAEKLGDIFKRVNSLPMGRAIPMRVGREADFPEHMLDRFADRDPNLGNTLSGLGAAGIALKPHEFQRVYLRSHGAHDLADRLHRSRAVFSPRPGDIRRVRITVMGRAPSSLMEILRPFMAERSTLTPIAIRRSSSIGLMPKHAEHVPYADSILNEVAEAYDSYRTNLALASEELMKSAMHTPEIMSSVYQLRGGSYSSPGSILKAVSLLPVMYFITAYKENMCGCGLSDIEFALKFAQCNPEITKYLSSFVAQSMNRSIL